VRDNTPLHESETQMLVSNQDIPKNNIVLEVKKSFERIKKIKNPTLVDIINALNPELFKDEGYRMIDFSYNSLCKCLLLKRLKGIRFQTGLVLYLMTHKRVRKKLGLKRIPDQTTISYFLTRILDDEVKDCIESVAMAIENIAPTYGVFLDVKAMRPEKPKKEIKERSQINRRSKESGEVCKIFKKRIFPFFDLKQNFNSIYEQTTLLSLLLHMVKEDKFAEIGSKSFRDELKKNHMHCSKCKSLLDINFKGYTVDDEDNEFICRKCGYTKRIAPSADVLFNRLRKYFDVAEIQKMFYLLFEIIWQIANKGNLFKARVVLAIDYTDLPFYGDKNTVMIVGKEYKDGTSYGYRFATVNIVESGIRFTLLALPFGPFDTQEEILIKLLNFARKRVKIRLVVADKEFFSSGTMKLFNRLGIKFIFPCTNYSNIKELLEVVPTPYVVNDCIMKSEILYNMGIVSVIRKGKELKYAYATNIRLDKDGMTAGELAALYKKRWGIETSYRVKKLSYLPKTTSKNYFVRLFYFLFSVLFYNLWILLCILVCLVVPKKINGKPIFEAKRFLDKIYDIEAG